MNGLIIAVIVLVGVVYLRFRFKKSEKFKEEAKKEINRILFSKESRDEFWKDNPDLLEDKIEVDFMEVLEDPENKDLSADDIIDIAMANKYNKEYNRYNKEWNREDKIKDKINEVLDFYTKDMVDKKARIEIIKDMKYSIQKIINDKKNIDLSIDDTFRLIDEFIAIQELKDEKNNETTE